MMPRMTAIDFLMEGDPAIRWQAKRDLLDESWEDERAKVATEGWGAQFLAAQNKDGSWPEGRWTGTLWTLLLLVDLGMPAAGDRFSRAYERVVGRLMPPGQAPSREVLTNQMDLCHLGFWLRIGSSFCPGDSRLPGLAEIVLSHQLADGGWNCRTRTKPQTCHSSFHTTFNVLEGLREAATAGIADHGVFRSAEARAMEFMLDHKMYRSDKTGAVIEERFLNLTYPSHWHYTVLRGLDYMSDTPFIKDRRLEDPLSVLEGRRKANGLWPVEKRIPGTTLFDMEKMGADSRWNTLRALRVLQRANA
jgi:hypothetical protein